jgi:uncharacterized protein with PIN domain
MSHEPEPKILICNECKEEFVFTSQAQVYFNERGYNEDPKRCKSCHTDYKKSQRGGSHKSEKPSKVEPVSIQEIQPGQIELSD